MKNLIKLAMSMLAATALLTACLITEPKSSDEQSTANNCAVKFSLQNAGGANSNVLFSESEDATPASVALSYRRNGDADSSDIPVTVELTPFGEGYITSDVISLGEGEYVLTRFDVLDAEGYTIYSTPMAGSNITTEVAISTPLAYSFTVAKGEVNTVNMQVIKVDEETDPADFGHVAFTFDVIGYERFFVDVLALFAYPEGWQYTTAELTVKNSAGETIKTASLDGKMNKVILSSSESYTLTVSKAGYASQTIALTQAQLEQYQEKPLVVRLREDEEAIEPLDTALAGETYTNSIGMEFVLVEAGTFSMGSENGESNEKPVHQVTLTKDYYIGKYEVTNAQVVAVYNWAKSNVSGVSFSSSSVTYGGQELLDLDGSYCQIGYSDGSLYVKDSKGNYPCIEITWYGAKAVADFLNQKEGVSKYHLPTEAQWEFAARGGNQSKGYTYAGSNTIGDVAWYSSNSGGGTHTVGTKLANELGLYDMSGNVFEWCNDWYGSYSSDAVTDPSGPSTGSYRVLRGGSWGYICSSCRVASRYSGSPSCSSYYRGFRILVHK